MNILKRFTAVAILVPFLALGITTVMPTSAQAACSTGPDADIGINTGKSCAKSDDQKGSLGVVIKDITNVLLFVIGAVAVIMLIIGGIRYTISNGDSSQITTAKNTILYGVIGLIVALLAYAIVNFVVGAFTSSAPADDAAAAGAS